MISSLTCQGHRYSFEWIHDQFDAALVECPPYTHQTLCFCQQWLRGETQFTLQTSGSTGKPKLITLHRSQMVASAHLTGQAVGLTAGDRALVCLNTAYIAGIMMLVRGFELGLALTIIEPTSNPLADFTSGEFDFIAIVPLQLQATLNNSAQRAHLNRMKAVLVGGAPVSHTLTAALQTVDAPIYHTYGMTETVSHVALRRLNGSAASDFFMPQRGIRLWLDERGCLSIRGPVTAEQTVATNDRVAFRADGAFRWLGRIDHVINSGGVKVQAEKVEAVLHKLLPDRRLFVVGMPDAVLGESVAAFVEGTPVAQDLATAIVAEGQLTKYERPKQIYYVLRFAETPTGKVDRKTTLKQQQTEVAR